MRITYIIAGAGDMYCGACSRDVNLLNGLFSNGHDVQVVPLYTPLRMDRSQTLPTTPIFYGGINVYLQGLSPLFRRMPNSIARLFDNPELLKSVSKWAIKTKPQELGAMTVSVLSGKDGHQKRELDRLINYLESQPRPDIVNITNSLLSGIAPELKRRLGVPVVCGLQGEDSFVESIPEPYESRAIEWMRKNAASIDFFISPGERYALKMADMLGVPKSKMRVVRAGVDTNIFQPRPDIKRHRLTVGYLSVINPTKGLDLLIDAFAVLASDQGRDVKLRVAGKVLHPDYWTSVQKKVRSYGLQSSVEYLGEVDFDQKLDFFRNIGVFCVPSRIAESRGMAVMEAMAAGAPAVVPDTGIYPEMIRSTGGGLLFASGDVNALANSIAAILDSIERASNLSRAAADGIAQHFSAEQMVSEVAAIFEELLGRKAENLSGSILIV